MYISPLSNRYASRESLEIFSQENKIRTFRRLWIALAKAQKELGLPITSEEITEMERSIDIIDFAQIEGFEKRFRHDVMANIHAFGALCPKAKSILHLGATSCYVTDNTDLILMREALFLLLQKCAHLLRGFAKKGEKEAHSPCLAYTHFQPAQPTTIGKRICLWLQDFFFDLLEWKRLYEEIPFLGAKGATGTQSSFLSLFGGDFHKVSQMELLIAKEFGFTKILTISGQTYTRKIDLTILNALASFAASAHKMATDLRLLAHEGEFVESFQKEQVGSSAMPYKKNPIYSERICGIARFVISLAQNPAYTLATQWLERSLDDSSNRRITLPEAFLGTDAILNLLLHLTSELHPVSDVALKNVQEVLPMLATENLMMAAVKKGGDRQALHEKLRLLTQNRPIAKWMQEIEQDPDFQLTKKEVESLIALPSLVGCAPEQVKFFIQKELYPLLNKWNLPIPPLHPIEI
ncbi:MAG TPA: adenylosuccinate lyase [Chlamydiales bacterium]|nr:adenylosuccinate lyase [Chlamydiales bacterium]